MSCEQFSDAIIDHACGAPIEPRGAAHLCECEICREAFDEHRRLLADADTVLRSELAVAASPDFVARVTAETRQVGSSAKWWTSPAPLWSGAAAAAIVIAIGAYVRAPVEGPPPMRASHVAAPSVHRPAEIATPESTSSTADAPAPQKPGAGRQGERPTRTVTRGGRSIAAGLPPVIVPPGQRQAIARLTELLRSGALDEVEVPPPARSADLFVEPLSIPEITVRDLPTVGEPDTSGSGGTD